MIKPIQKLVTGILGSEAAAPAPGKTPVALLPSRPPRIPPYKARPAAAMPMTVHPAQPIGVKLTIAMMPTATPAPAAPAAPPITAPVTAAPQHPIRQGLSDRHKLFIKGHALQLRLGRTGSPTSLDWRKGTRTPFARSTGTSPQLHGITAAFVIVIVIARIRSMA